jgi:DNA polymerase-3 subunit delta'
MKESAVQEHIVRALRAVMSKGLVAHAYLFYGPAGTGKKTLAGSIAQALNCAQFPQGPCETCPSCLKVARGTHPDVHWIIPEGKVIRIEQVRQAVKAASLQPREGRRHIFILDAAQGLTPEAANSLLKTLEEPPAAVVFILLAEKPGLLPPTVVSRCQVFPLRHLAELPERGGVTLPLLGEAAAFLTALRQDTGVSALSGGLAGKENLPAVLDLSLTMLRDLLVLLSGGKETLLHIERETYAGLDGQWTAGETFKAITVLLKLQKDLNSPVNVRLAAEAALRRLKEELG